MKAKHLWLVMWFICCSFPVAGEQTEVVLENPVLFHFGNPDNENYALPEEKALMNQIALDELLGAIWRVIEDDKYGVTPYERRVSRISPETGTPAPKEEHTVTLSLKYDEYIDVPVGAIVYDLALPDLKIVEIRYTDVTVAKGIPFLSVDFVSLDNRGITINLFYFDEEGYVFIINGGEAQHIIEGRDVLAYIKNEQYSR